MQETWVRSLGWEDPLEKGMATLSSILAWRIPWTGESGRLQSMGSQRLRHNWTINILGLPFLGGPVFKTVLPMPRCMGSIPGCGTKFPHAEEYNQKKRKNSSVSEAMLPGFTPWLHHLVVTSLTSRAQVSHWEHRNNRTTPQSCCEIWMW